MGLQIIKIWIGLQDFISKESQESHLIDFCYLSVIKFAFQKLRFLILSNIHAKLIGPINLISDYDIWKIGNTEIISIYPDKALCQDMFRITSFIIPLQYSMSKKCQYFSKAIANTSTLILFC